MRQSKLLVGVDLMLVLSYIAIIFFGCLAIYSSETKANYEWHIDKSKTLVFDTKWTVLLNLSEKKYSGGEFQIFNQGPYAIPEFKSGAMLMFKSNLNHRVTPVTEGERKTFTIFLSGPRWK